MRSNLSSKIESIKMTVVYRYKTYSISTDTLELSDYYATKAFIKSTSGTQLLLDTELMIDSELVDGNGRVLASKVTTQNIK
jgi:hypothetical protein